MKEQRTYKRFDLLAALAILGCIGMVLFEGIFVFELYDRIPLESDASAPVQPLPAIKPPAEPVIEKTVPAVTNAPVVVPSAEIEVAPAVVPAG